MAKNKETELQESPAQSSTQSVAQSPMQGQQPALFSLSELAVKHGKTFHRLGKDGNLYRTVPAHDSVYKAEHMQADALHGWTKHQAKESVSVQLSDVDYLAALESAKKNTIHAPANKRAAKG